METTRRIGLGCMRLSTERKRDDDAALEVIAAALAAGASLLDTAHAYAHGEADLGHNERLVARALAAYPERAKITVVSKTGMARPSGRWVPDGRAKAILQSAEASAEALGGPPDLLLLHTPDPRVPFETSVRALGEAHRAGLARRVGLSNVSPREIERARDLIEVAAVEIEFGPFEDRGLLGATPNHCANHAIMLLAHRPFGGRAKLPRFRKDETLRRLAAKHGATPFEVALSWLADTTIPLPGATTVASAESIGRALRLALDDDDRAALTERFRPLPVATPVSAAVGGDVVLIIGSPAAGKTSAVAPFVERGYHRLNRDERGGRLSHLATLLDKAASEGERRFVLDNTYPAAAARIELIRVADRHGLPVRCLWLTTSLEDAQWNACRRLVERHGKLPSPEELFTAPKTDPNTFGPLVLFRHRRLFEPPTLAEGFASIEEVPYDRAPHPGGPAIILSIDAVLWKSRSSARTPTSPEDVVVDPARVEVLREHARRGIPLYGITWQPNLADGTLSETTLRATLARLETLLDVALPVEVCGHPGGPPVCWCRLPLPGLGALLVVRERLDPARCIFVGEGPFDRGFATRARFPFREPEAFFGP